MSMYKWFVFFAFIFAKNVHRTKANEGLPCGNGNSLAGTCRYIEDCPIAFNERHKLPSCGRYNLYCCPNEQPRRWEVPSEIEDIPEMFPHDEPMRPNDPYTMPKSPRPNGHGQSVDGVPCGEYQSRGVCRTIFDCAPALQQVVKFRRHQFRQCGFEKDVEVVCCPNKFQNENPPTDSSIHNNRTPKPPTRKPPTRTPTIKPATRAPTRKPPTKPWNTDSGLRKSVQACNEYSNEISPIIEPQIFGGSNAADGEFPHMAALGYRIDESDEVSWRCGGSLISNRYVLTAAHCLAPAKDRSRPFMVRLGRTNIFQNNNVLTSDDYLIESVTIHPNYLKLAKINDIALVRLARPVNTSVYVRPACLYTKPDEPTLMVITGWGDTKTRGAFTETLQKAEVKLVPIDICNATYTKGAWPRPVHENSICAHNDGKTDACSGDSGGPLQFQEDLDVYSIVGITSIGLSCGGTAPGIYTKVYNFLDWIENIVW